jgi:ElaB/YqjD/DUF883 family membrane-anchored ribosome-binding protein
MASQIQDLVQSDTLERARDKIARASGELEQLDVRVREFVRERPVTSLLAAAFVGHLIGRLVSSATR